MAQAAPHNTKVISVILRSLGIEECEPNTILQIHEFMFKYATDVLRDASQYAQLNDRSIISEKDIKLALQSKVGRYYVPPPSRAYMNEISSMVNSRSLRQHVDEHIKLSGKGLLNHEPKLDTKNDEKIE